MTAGSTVSSAFAGFRLVREHPRVIAIWALAAMVFSLAQGLFAAANEGPDVMRVLDLVGRAKPDPNALMLDLERIAPTYLFVVFTSMCFQALMMAALNRAAVAPESDRFGYLRVGADELRQLVLICCLMTVMVCFCLALALLEQMAALGAPVVAMALCLTYGLMRLSLASPLTFDQGRLNLFGSWALTRRGQWDLMRTYILALLLAAAVYLIGMTFIAALMAAAFGGVNRLAQVLSPDLSSVRTFLSPSTIALMVLQSTVTALIMPVLLCPAIEIYRRSVLARHVPENASQATSPPWG